MTNPVIKKRTPLLYYVLVIFLVFFTAKPIPDFDVNFSGISSWLFLGLTLLLLIVKRIPVSKSFIWITIILLLINLISIFKYHEFYPRFFLIYWFALFYTYITLKIIGKDFFRVFESTLYYWSVFVILPIYVFSLFFPDALRSFLTELPLTFDQNQIYKSRVYSFLYCFMTDASIRNSGFGWEPGMFASIISVAMTVNLINNEFKFNRRFWMFGVVLFTTMSTTGYILFGVLVIWVFFNRYINKSYGIIILPVFIIIIYFVVSSNVITGKMNYSLNQAKKTEMLLKEAKKDKDSYVHPQRIASLLITFKDIKANPVFGTLGNFDDRWYIKKYGKLDNFRAISGIGTFLTIFGFTGFLIFLYAFTKSIKAFKIEKNIENGYYLILIVLIISFSYYIFDSSLFYVFIFYFHLRYNSLTTVLLEKLAANPKQLRKVNAKLP